ncbi:hypothetical protein K469DRAFT_704299 [Zopfia rhizophila CBS 207.26]|uniref:Uncharacterized protein n=1 Tax=Zopfia rhizophila CBS 207.26 TaxID=1314779 RepID=A0A6A6E7U4_9PEZI|nr:hypothetical protein K469DRAFT_704299 [Zopfia rhizophila CBS 207.26]
MVWDKTKRKMLVLKRAKGILTKSPKTASELEPRAAKTAAQAAQIAHDKSKQKHDGPLGIRNDNSDTHKTLPAFPNQPGDVGLTELVQEINEIGTDTPPRPEQKPSPQRNPVGTEIITQRLNERPIKLPADVPAELPTGHTVATSAQLDPEVESESNVGSIANTIIDETTPDTTPDSIYDSASNPVPEPAPGPATEPTIKDIVDSTHEPNITAVDASAEMLGRICDLFRETKEKCIELRVPNPESPEGVEGAVRNALERYQSASGELVSLEKKVEELTNDQKELNERLARKAKDLKECEGDLKASEEALKKEGEINKVLEGTNRTLKSEIKKEAETNKLLSNIAETLRDEIESKKKTIGELQGRTEALKHDLQQKSLAVEKLQVTVDMQQSEIQKQTKTIKEHQGTIWQLQADTQTKVGTIHELNETVKTLQYEIQDQTKTIKELQGTAKTLRGEISELKIGHNTELRNVRNQHSTEISGLKNKHHTDLEHLRSQYASHIAEIEGAYGIEISSLNDTIFELENDKKKLRQTHDGKLRSIDIEHQKEVTRLKLRIEQLERNEETLRNTHQSTLRNMKDFHQGDKAQAMEEVKGKAEAEKFQTQRRHEQEIERLKTNFVKERMDWHGTHQNTKNGYENQLADAVARHKEEIAALNARIAELESSAEAKEERMRKEFQAEQEKAKNDFVARTSGYRKKIETLKGALVAREHFKGLSDPQIAARFQKLASEVDEFSRVPWDTRKQENWPFPENTLRRSENTRKLKKHIVQSSIWYILHRRIFFTPFQVLGEEGELLQREWTQGYGRGKNSKEFPHWPEPSEGSEKWRSDRVKECLEALEQARNPSEERQKRKQGYNQTLGTAVEEISQAVKRISLLDERKLQTLQDLVRLAGRLWLDIGSQRHRIIVVVPGSSENVLKGTKTGSKPIELVLKPEVRRFGNSQGQELDRVDVVGGCKGEYESYDPR